RRQIDERFERRPGLALGTGDAVELATREIAAPREPSHVAGTSLQHDNGALEWIVVRLLEAWIRAFQALEPDRQSSLGEMLRLEVERRVDGEAAHHVGVVAHARDAPQYLVDEKRRLERLRETLLQTDRLGPRRRQLRRAQPRILRHQLEDLVP